jgi:hypothetical protein
MPSRNELVIRAHAVGITPSNYPNDSKLEQKVLYMEKNGTTYTATLGTGVLTGTGDLANGDQVVIGNTTYTFRTTLTGVKATGTYTNASTAVAGTTVTIDGITYTYFDAISASAENPYGVLVGANPTASLANLIKAIDDSGTEGTHYGIGTNAHPRVSGVSSDATTAVVTYDAIGVIGNSALTSENSAGSWASTALTGGVDNVVNEVLRGANLAASLDNLKLAINNSATEGTEYSFGTKAHTQVTATTNSNTQQTVEARNAAFDNASIATTDPVDGGTAMSWGATTLASGVRGVIAVNTSTAAGSAGVSGDKNVV